MEALGLALAAMPLRAEVSAEELAALGRVLRPVGADIGCNAVVSIPEWNPAAQRRSLPGEYPGDQRINADKPCELPVNFSSDEFASASVQTFQPRNPLLSASTRNVGSAPSLRGRETAP